MKRVRDENNGQSWKGEPDGKRWINNKLDVKWESLWSSERSQGRVTPSAYLSSLGVIFSVNFLSHLLVIQSLVGPLPVLSEETPVTSGTRVILPPRVSKT